MKKSFVILIILFSVTALLAGCTDDTHKPSASFTIEPLTAEKGETIFLNSTSVDDAYQITEYKWFIDDTFLKNGKEITHVFDQNGTYDITLEVTNDQGASDSKNKMVVIGSNEAKQKLFGKWQWNGNNQTGNWTFYENNTLKSVFTGVLPTGEYGSSSVIYWEYAVDDTKIYFSNPSNERAEPGTYDYELLEDDTLLRVSYQNSTADWYKIS